MAVLNQFQKYSQTENAVTNNVLFMLSQLYKINPKYYEEYIDGLSDDSQLYEVIPTFKQQVGNKGNGIIDGYIEIKASKIIIETKLHGLEWIQKLVKYSDSFDKNEYRLLFHISSVKYPKTQIEAIEKELDKRKELGKINFQSLTYQDLIDQLKELAKNYPHEYVLKTLTEDFENYCTEMRLTQKSNLLRAMACGQSYELNVKHQFYFDLASRGYSNFKYLGIYKEKSIRQIGLIENIIEANWNFINGLEIIKFEYSVTNEQKQRLVLAIQDSVQEGWKVEKNHKFFLLKDFTNTDFKKSTPGGIFRVKYLNLEKYNLKITNKVEELAEQLRLCTWE